MRLMRVVLIMLLAKTQREHPLLSHSVADIHLLDINLLDLFKYLEVFYENSVNCSLVYCASHLLCKSIQTFMCLAYPAIRFS
jgi:hypothetical protein